MTPVAVLEVLGPGPSLASAGGQLTHVVQLFTKSRRLQHRDDVFLVVANLYSHTSRDTWIHPDMSGLGLDWHERSVPHDLNTGEH